MGSGGCDGLEFWIVLTTSLLSDWSAKLAGEKYGPVISWFNAWFNFMGEIGGISGVAFQVATFIVGAVEIHQPWDYSVGYIVGIAIALLVLQGIINSVSEHALGLWTNFSVFVHVFGSLAIFVTLLATAPTRQSAKWLFTEVVNYTGWDSNGFAFVLAFLLPGWTFVGYDASAHVSGEFDLQIFSLTSINLFLFLKLIQRRQTTRTLRLPRA